MFDQNTDTDIDNNNNNNNYKLFKLVFKNKFLSNYIFNFISLINRQIINDSNKNNNNNLKKIVKFEEANFNWLIQNKQYPLLLYKIKLGYKFSNNNNIEDEEDNTEEEEEEEEEFTFSNLNNFLKYLENIEQNEMDYYLNKFYFINSNKLNKLKFKDSFGDYFNLLEFSIYINNFKFFKLISNQEIFKNYNNNNNKNQKRCLYEIAFKFGNLEIIKYIHKEMGIKIKENRIKQVIVSSLLSDNRSLIIDYIFDEINLFSNNNEEKQQKQQQQQQGYHQEEEKEEEEYLFDKFKLNILLLNHKNFKRLYEINLYGNSIYSKYDSTSLLKRFFNDYLIYQHNEITFNQFLEFIQNLIYLFSNQIEFLIHKSNFNLLLKNINEILLLANSGSSSSSISNSENNVEKEIIKLYIFNFLKIVITNSNQLLNLIIVNYYRKYNEFNLINKELVVDDEVSCGGSGGMMMVKSSISCFNKWLDLAIYYEDSKFLNKIFDIFDIEYYQFIPFNYNIIFQKKKKKKEKEEIEKRFEFYKTVLRYQLFNHSNSVLIRLIKSIKINYHSEIIINEILEFISKTSIESELELICASNLLKKRNSNNNNNNNNLFIYLFNSNHSNLFNWNNEIIGKLVIENGNLELIKFIHLNKIGSLEVVLLNFNRKLNQEVIEILNKLGYKFIIK